MGTITTQDLLTVPGLIIVVGLIIQLVKQYLPDQWEPLIALGIAVVLALLGSLAVGQQSGQELLNAFLRGLAAGAGSVGAFQVLKPFNLLQTKAQQMVKSTQNPAP